jgi:hypothetical protein
MIKKFGKSQKDKKIIICDGAEFEVINNFIYIYGVKYEFIDSMDNFLKVCTIDTACINNYFFDVNIDINFPKLQNNYNNIIFVNCIFNKHFVLNYSSLSNNNVKHWGFYDTKFLGECIFNPKAEIESIKFDECHFEKKLKINNYEKKEVHDCGTSKGGNYKTGQENEVKKDGYEIRQKNKVKINKLEIVDCTASKDAYLRIGFLEVQDFSIKNFRNPENTELNIGDCFFHNFKLTNFRNMGKFKLFKINSLSNEKPTKKLKGKDNVELPTTFDINNTSIGKTDFQSLNINSFERVKMFDNIFTEVDYTNMQWKTEIKVGQCQNNKITKLAKQRDIYRTLKNVASRNNDQPQALKFFAKEMEKYTQSVENNKKIYSLSDRTTLWFNKNTNNFGLDFWKPIGILLYLSMMFYSLFKIPITNSNQAIFLYILLFSLIVYGALFAVKEKEIKYITIPHWIFLLIPIFITSFGVFEYDDFIKEFFIFLNPLHKMIDFNSYKSLSAFSYAIDFLFRIVEGLLIYQIIQAFRKYGRKF